MKERAKNSGTADDPRSFRKAAKTIKHRIGCLRADRDNAWSAQDPV